MTVDPEAAMEVAQALMEELVVDPRWAQVVVPAAIARLPDQLRKVALHMLEHGLDYNSKYAPVDLGISEGAYRSAKKRVFDRLRVLIPAELRSLGIEPEAHGIQELDLAVPGRLPAIERGGGARELMVRAHDPGIRVLELAIPAGLPR